MSRGRVKRKREKGGKKSSRPAYREEEARTVLTERKGWHQFVAGMAAIEKRDGDGSPFHPWGVKKKKPPRDTPQEQKETSGRKPWGHMFKGQRGGEELLSTETKQER